MFPATVDAPLYVHQDDRAQTEKRMHVRASFSRRHMLGDDFEVIPIPGHTPGATAYLWDSGEHRMLFTGDTLYLHDGEWVAGLLDSSDRAAFTDSLRAHPRPRLRRARPVGRERRAAALRAHRSRRPRRRIDALLESL